MGAAPLDSLISGDVQRSAQLSAEAAHGPYPLTKAQEGVWFVEQLAPGKPTYNIPEAWLIHGQLDVVSLQASLDYLVARHEALRAFVRVYDGKPKQLISPAARLELQIFDLTQKPLEGRLKELLQREAERPFDLGCAPLARASLFRTGPEEHTLLLNNHHILWDAWSQAVFVRELAQTYSAFANDQQPSLPELSIQFVDYALWETELLATDFGAKHLDYWQEKLRTMPEPVFLPADHPRSGPRTFAGATEFRRIGPTLTQALKDLSRREGVTVFMTLLAAFKTLLFRYTANERIVVGTPMARRDRVELELLLGFCVHTQALESNLSGDPTFAELLKRVREVVLEGFAHQDVPCQLAVPSSTETAVAGSRGLFEVVFGWQHASPHNWSAPGIQARKMELDTRTAKFDWTVLVTETEEGLDLRSEFSTDLFEPSTMSRMLDAYLLLLEKVLTSPHSKISRLPLQSELERHQVVVEWNQTRTVYEQDQQVHQVFETQAARCPQAVALEFKGERLSYGELNARADQVASHLQAIGVKSGMRVGLCLERSFELVIGILGILKAGAVYVPLDPEYPHERLEFMVEDASLRVVVCHTATQARLAGLAKTLVVLDREDEPPRRGHFKNLANGGSPTDAAYVMYTSGSTGKPKGVVVPHRAVIRLVRKTNYMEFSPEQTFLQLAPITFDASTFEIWGALLNGARLVIYPPERPSLSELGRVVRGRGVTTLWLTAGLFHQMAEHQIEDLAGLKYLLAGGDVLAPALVSKAVLCLPNCQLINGYGPTENTTFTCCYRVGRSWPANRPVPIGKPIANSTVYVLDQDLAPVPIGVPGELYTGGDGLGLEYLNQPALTEAKFVANPFGDESSRLYRTGDIVRWRADGNLEFLRRADEQVKLRGYRVEPGEVESVILMHPPVESCAVIVREDEFVGKYLAAYLVLRSGHTSSVEDVRSFLEQKLPGYMVPRDFIVIDTLPLTHNGKVDRRALGRMSASAQSNSEANVAPRTATESAIAEIWCDILGRQHIGIEDDFFRLGGHSLLATQIISRISKTCGVELPVIAIFEAPTVARLAAMVELAQAEQPQAGLAQLSPSRTAQAADLLAHLDELTEAQVEELLRDPELKNAL